MNTAATLLLLAFTTVAAIDGFYFHLYKYRLWERPDTRREHALHTLNACLFPFTVVPLSLADVGGPWLWAGVALNAALVAVESVDVLEERGSRAQLGGLSSIEYWMHFLMSGLRWGYMVAALATVPAARWTSPASWSWRLPSGPTDILGASAWGVALMGLPVAAIHLHLALKGRRNVRSVGGDQLAPAGI